MNFVRNLTKLIPQQPKNLFHLFQAGYALLKYNFPATKLKVIGVTGTKGKTTTCFLIYHMLSKLGKKVGLITSISAKIGSKVYDTGFHVTNPDSLTLNKFLVDMVNVGCDYAVLEVSSHGIDQNRIAGIKFDVGVLTNIAPEHLDYHKTFENYKNTKMSFINSAKNKVISPKITRLKLLNGDFNNLNLEAALMAVQKLGIKREDALKTIKSFRLPEGRLMKVKNNLGLSIYIDFAHTPDSLQAVLSYLRKNTKGNLIVVFGCAGERDPSKRTKMGEIAARLANFSIFTAEDPRSEDVDLIISTIAAGATKVLTAKELSPSVYKRNDFNNTKKHLFFRVSERGEAISFAIRKLASRGDTVVLCGKGHETSMAYGGIEYPWSDKKAVELVLKGKVLEIKRP